MSAALQLPMVWGAGISQAVWNEDRKNAVADPIEAKPVSKAQAQDGPVVSLGFYRKHTESILRRYLYASMQVGRAPSILSDPVCRGWCSSRPVRTFEDAVIFVLDIERCIQKLSLLDRQLISRIVLQEYTHAETASLMGLSQRTVGVRFPLAIDRLTVKLLESELLILPD